MTKLTITVGQHHLTATLLPNATVAALRDQLPLTLPMLNLYRRELTYRFPQALPAEELQTSGYAVGDIAYWAPRHSFVIFYQQTGEIIGDLQKVGHIEGSLDFLRQAGNLDVVFALGDE
ncbi:cyclophilin-like fold protein [Levilactobacillus fujinensis]|uniref:Cyclophilin-like fold protein n=1 Tax=Levilactobacillus fujinensis TaxID=2486024 RepID=A0ABW1TEZ6_9LACO|nr:cyclophilin-like fold protein [Levilactobacillus fujinensis]